MTILAVSATTAGIAMALSGVAQAIKIYKRKSAGDISVLTYAILIFGAIIWILYGIEIKNFPIILSNSIGFFISGFILIGWFLYG